MEYIEKNEYGEDVRVVITSGGTVVRELLRPGPPVQDAAVAEPLTQPQEPQ